MSFADTYHQEVIQTRRDRSRRAFFWSRILGFVLMVTIAAILRAEPDLRRALMGASMNAVAAVTDLETNPGASSRLTTQVVATEPSRLPATKVKVNRIGTRQIGGSDIMIPSGVTDQAMQDFMAMMGSTQPDLARLMQDSGQDPAALAQQIERAMSTLRP